MSQIIATTQTARRPLVVTAEQEEFASFVTHGFGLLVALGAAGQLTGRVWMSANFYQQFGLMVFAASMVAVYAASTLYHGVAEPRAKEIARLIDHAAIYLMIAGTYTPITLTYLHGTACQLLFGVVWGLALVGIVSRWVWPKQSNMISTVVYMLMGWSAVVTAGPLLSALPSGCLALILTGGLWYTLGVAFYVREDLPYAHAIWHLFVMAGTLCHFLAVWGYMTP